MAQILFGLIIFLVGFVVVTLLFRIDPNVMEWKTRSKITLLFALALVVIPAAMIKFVPANSVGIKFNVFSGVSEQVLLEGMNIKSPFDKVYIIPTEIQTRIVSGLSGQTEDAQWIKIEMDVKYRVSRQNALKVFLDFRTLENAADNFITPIAQRSIESVTTQYNVMEILGEKRNEAYSLIEEEVKTRLAASGIEFVSLVLTDTDAGAAIELAIEQEAVAKKAVETAMQVQARAQIEADTKVLQAEAAARVAIIEAQAQADANILLSKSITPEILKRMEMEARIKWGWVTIQTGSVIVDSSTR